MDRVRPSAIAGMFYPASPLELNAQLDELLGRVHPHAVAGEVVALIGPHAGYDYSGLTAAHGYKLLEGKSFDGVIIVSPSHREFFKGISIYGGSAYSTPLGIVPIDVELRRALVEDDDLITTTDSGHHSEHAVEVHLPFLQRMLGEFSFVPIVVGEQRADLCLHLGKKLGQVLAGRRWLMIASTDLSHFHPYAVARKVDRRVIETIQSFDHKQLMDDLETGSAEACGGGPTVAVMCAARDLGADRIQVLHHCNSGDITGDRSGVVGYLSAAAIKSVA